MSASPGLAEPTATRLRVQLEALPLILAGVDDAALHARPPGGKWSAHENLAHLARQHDVFVERLRRILEEDRPALARYRAEDDPDWPRWAALSNAEVRARLARLRRDIVARVEPLAAEQLARTGIHPTLGELPLALWLEFFLLHEAHHLYVVMGLLKR